VTMSQVLIRWKKKAMQAMKVKGGGCATVTAFMKYKNKKSSVTMPPQPLFIFFSVTLSQAFA